jgi:hypothetical protein
LLTRPRRTRDEALRAPVGYDIACWRQVRAWLGPLRTTTCRRTIIANAIRMATDVQVYCSSSPVGIPKLLRPLRSDAGRMRDSQDETPWIGAQAMN